MGGGMKSGSLARFGTIWEELGRKTDFYGRRRPARIGGVSTATAALKQSQQLALDGFANLGVKTESLPSGIADVSAKELKFVNNLLKHGQMARAALEAGYQGEKDGAGVWASKTLRKAKVFRIYQAALSQVSQDADKLVGRVYERSVMWHERAKSAHEAIEQAQAKVEFLERERQERMAEGVQDSKLHREAIKTAERDLAAAQTDERRYAALATKEDTLLGSLLGKLNLNVNLSGEVVHYTAGNEVTEAFAVKRREWEAQHGRN